MIYFNISTGKQCASISPRELNDHSMDGLPNATNNGIDVKEQQ
jgi:hypothetical protein